jgi:hypothetical protein
MVALSKIDIRENILRSKGRVLDILLTDQTKSNKNNTRNIIWATDSYQYLSRKDYAPNKPILKEQITALYGKRIQPRASKSREEQSRRTKDKAEVFTPLRIVAEMNKAVANNLKLSENHSWLDFISTKWLEITCGEAPYIASRYDPTSTKQALVPLKKRVGFLDLKMLAINKNVSDKGDWLFHAEEALKSCYGYEWQGDSLLIARENILLTMNDFYLDKFHKNLTVAQLEKFAEIISWNIFQMDGINYTVPLTRVVEKRKVVEDGSGMFTAEMLGEEKREYTVEVKKEGRKVKIMDWEEGKTIKFVSLLEKG